MFLQTLTKTKRIQLVLIFAVVLILVGQNVTAGPEVVLPESAFNFGKTPQQCTVSKTFWIKSIGDDTLRVLTLVPGCGCTTMPLKDSVLAPGDSASFQVNFTTHSYRGFVTKKPYLTTNVNDEKVYCEINAEIIVDPSQYHPVRLNPYKLDVSQFTVEPRRKANAWIINSTNQELNLVMIDSSGKDFVADLPEFVKPKDSVQITITVNEDAVEKEFDQSITFYVTDDVHTRYTLPIKRMYRLPVTDKKDTP